MKHYLTNIIKGDTSSDDMNEKVYHWSDTFEIFHKKYIIMPSESFNYSFPEDIWYITVRSLPDLLTDKTKQDVILIHPYNWYIVMFFLDN